MFPKSGETGSHHRAPSERDTPFPEPSIHLSKSPVYKFLSRFPSGAPMERDAHLQNDSDKLYSIEYCKSSVQSLVI
jgi:hypothetical protein